MINTRWLTVNRSEFAEKSAPSERGTKKFLSPYALPEAVRAYTKSDKDMVIFEFKYIPINEKTEKIEVSKGITFEIGKQSKRIYKINADKQILENREEFEKSPIENAIQLLIDTMKASDKNIEAYSANKNIIHQYRTDLRREAAI